MKLGANQFEFIDLFAGIGGFRLSMEAIGGKCSFTSEWDKFALQTYKTNFPESSSHQVAGDIRPFAKNPSLIPAHDVLVGGFPCQPFSIAGVSKKNHLGLKHGFEDKRQGDLFFEVVKILKHHRPAMFILENVKNLLVHDKGKTFKRIQVVLRDELGYDVHYRVISSEPWVPQKRQRLFIVGFYENVGFSFDAFQNKIPPIETWPRLGSILQKSGQVDEKYTLSEKLWTYLQKYKDAHRERGNGFGYGLFNRRDVARTLSSRYYKDGAEILIFQKNNRPRRLTPRECASLMGFQTNHRNWSIPVSDTQAYRQFGNAVVVPVVDALANFLIPYLKKAIKLKKHKLIRERELLLSG